MTRRRRSCASTPRGRRPSCASSAPIVSSTTTGRRRCRRPRAVRQPRGVPVVGARPARARRGPITRRRARRRRRLARTPGGRLMARVHRGAEERLRRLLVMLPWLMERGEVPLAEVAERFRLTESEVAADLELVAMCGLAAVRRRVDRHLHRRGHRVRRRAAVVHQTAAPQLDRGVRAARRRPGGDGAARGRRRRVRSAVGSPSSPPRWAATHDSMPGSARGSTSTSSDQRPPTRSPTRRGGSNGCASRTGARLATSRPNA